MSLSFRAFTCVAAVCLVWTFSTAVTAQEAAPAAGTLKLTKLKTTGFDWPSSNPDFVGTGKKYLVVFGADLDSKTYDGSIRTINMKLKGKVTSSGDVVKSGFLGDEGMVFSAHWIGKDKSGYGLLFVFYLVDENLDEVKLDVAEFDSKGELTESFRNVLTLKSAKNSHFYGVNIGVGVSEKRMGIALGVGSIPADSSKIANGHFVETDLHGEAIGKSRTIVMPNGGKMRECRVSAPAWNGKQWMIPLKISKSEAESGGGAVRTGAIVMAAPVAGKKNNLIPKTIYDLTSKPDYILEVYFLRGQPETGAPGKPSGAGSDLYLMYQYERYVTAGQGMYRHEYIYYLQKIASTGAKTGAPKIVNMPAVDLSMVYNKSNSYLATELISPPVQESGDQFVLAMTRSVEEYSYSGGTRKYEQVVVLIGINRVTGAATLLARKNLFLRGLFAVPLLKLIKGKFSLVASMWPRTADGSQAPGEYYYSRY
jgi:hypothetical protein